MRRLMRCAENHSNHAHRHVAANTGWQVGQYQFGRGLTQASITAALRVRSYRVPKAHLNSAERHGES
ncbi:Uncharacterised protein [Vibrio cholerae]|nr:Uncharacterised protein [Vibrio cholerae]